MITFKTFLKEDKDSLQEFLKANCSEFCTEAGITLSDDIFGQKLLFRGFTSTTTSGNLKALTINGEKLSSFIIAPRQDRRPFTMNRKVHLALDEFFESRFEFKARSASAFCSGEFETAKTYGTVYAIFPIGPYKYVWSEIVSDLFLEIRIDTSFPQDKITDKVFKIVDNLEYQNTNLKEAIASGNEIMLSCSRYLAVPYTE